MEHSDKLEKLLKTRKKLFDVFQHQKQKYQEQRKDIDAEIYRLTGNCPACGNYHYPFCIVKLTNNQL
jgi:hypothetical protein